MKESFVFLAEGFEDLEAITVIDLLRRAEMPVKTVSVTPEREVKSAHGVTMKADIVIDDMKSEEAAWLILPGGLPGAYNLYNCGTLLEMLVRQAKSKEGRIAAICASPAVVLGQAGLLKGVRATCYPGFEEKMTDAIAVDAPVVVSEKFVLGNGPANAMAWSLAIIKKSLGEEASCRIADGLLYTGCGCNCE